MRSLLTPLWLVVLYSIAGYGPREVAAIGGWSVKTVTARIKQWQIEPSELTPKGRALRKYIDTIRKLKGNAAARRAVAKLLMEIAGPFCPRSHS